MSAPRAAQHRAGQPAPKVSRFAEVIGPPECPILKRWTLIPWREVAHENSEPRVKLLVHHFLPNADDRDVHDHPRPFWTLVLRGYYDDMKICAPCEGDGSIRGGGFDYTHGLSFSTLEECKACHGKGVVLNERMCAGKLRFRPATHRHRTKVGPKGCWTIVLMGPLRRRWGFWRWGRWWYWRDYERRFGFGMRCDDD